MITHADRTIIGSIPDSWEAIPLRTLLTRSASGDWGDEQNDVAVSVLRSTNFTNNRSLDFDDVAVRGFSAEKANSFDIRDGDILIERSGGGPTQPVGRVVVASDDLPTYGYSNFVQLLRVDDAKMSPDYAAWCLFRLHQSGIITRLQHQTTQMRNLDYRDYVRVLLPRPPRHEQDRIADALSAAIHAATATDAELLAARAVKVAALDEIFARGLPGRHTEFDHTKWLDHPAGWARRPLRRIAQIDAGFTMGRDLAGHDTVSVPYVTVVNVQDGRLELERIGTSMLKASELADGLLTPGDVLMTEGGDRDKLGRGAMWTGAIAECAYQNHIFRVRLEHDVYRPKLFHYLIQTQAAKRYFWAHAKQTSNLCTINSRELGRFAIAVPPDLDEQDAMVEQLERIDRLIDAIEAKHSAIDLAWRSMLQQLLTGQLRAGRAVAA